MKISARILSLIVIAALATFYMGCGGDDDDESKEEVQLNKLKGSWALQSANDGTDRTTSFPDLVLTISGDFAKGGIYNYSFTGTRPNPSPWPVSGTFKFGADPTKVIIRDPGTGSEISMEYQITDTNLTFNFTISDGSPGWAGGTSRTNNVTGEWTFEFVKQ